MPEMQPPELPKRLPLVISPENRGQATSKDARLVNCYVEIHDEEVWIYKRPGVATSSRPTGGAATGRGLYNWKGNIFSIFGNTLYKDGVAVSGTVDTTNGVYRFESNRGATPKLQLGNGVKAYNYDAGGGLVLISDADFPAAFVKGWGYLDGTTYVGTTSAALKGSGINDTVNWDATNTLQAQIEADEGVAVAKHLVYVIMFKQWSTEVFYDAGNATGSPLAPVQGAKINYGCLSADSVVEADGMLFWVGTNKSAAPQVFKMEGLKTTIVSIPSVERLLDGADFTTVYAFSVKEMGHLFYILTIKNSNFTLAYDVTQDRWSQWTDPSGNYFPFVASTYGSVLQHYLQHESDGYIYTLDEDEYADAGSVFPVDIYTPNFDGGTSLVKYLPRMGFVADRVKGSVLKVRCNDDDYDATKWTNFRTVNLDQKKPYLTDCGSFVRRAYHFRHQCDTAFRIKAVDLTLQLGVL